MNILPEKITRRGFEYRFIKRSDDVAIYSQSYIGDNEIIAYEVFEVKNMPTTELFGKIVEAKELYPNDEDFGKSAFTCTSFDRAEIRMQELLTRIEIRIQVREKNNDLQKDTSNYQNE